MMGIVMTATTNIDRKKSGRRAFFFVARLVVGKVDYFVDYFTEAMVGLYN